MKKLKYLFLASAIALACLLTSCESTPSNEPTLSEISSNHMTVQVTKSTVRITLSKKDTEDIKKIDVVEVPNGSVTSVKMNQNSITFNWPFAQPSKEYKLCAKIYGSNSYSEEFVTFKTEDKIKSTINYSNSYNTSEISLVAKGNKRIITLNTDYNTINSALSKVKPESSKFVLSLYSGVNYNANSKDSVLIGSITSNFDKSALDKFKNEFDIIENASAFNLSPKEINNALSQNKTYFAVAYVDFSLKDYPDCISFAPKGIYSNDTIYTPVDQSVLQQSNASSKPLETGYAK